MTAVATRTNQAPAPNSVQAVRVDLDKMRSQIQAALPKHVDIDRFVRTVLTAVQVTPSLITADRATLLRACIEAATDGLIPDGREGAIVPYKGRAQWLPMVWGIVKLVRQSGELESLGTRVVREGEQFEHWIDESGEHFRHVPAYGNDDAPLRLVYAYARTKDGGVYFEAMGAAEIRRFREMSKASSPDSPWAQWFEEMAKVRPLKRLCKRLPMSTDAMEAIERDNRREGEMLGTGAQIKPNPLAALNQSIVGATPEALAHDPSPSAPAPALKPAEPVSAGEPAEPPAVARDDPKQDRGAEAIEMKVVDFCSAIYDCESAEDIHSIAGRGFQWAESIGNEAAFERIKAARDAAIKTVGKKEK